MNEPDPLETRSIVLVGLMGAGKSSVGRRLAQRIGLPFLDSDTEVALAAGASIPEIFERHGEACFRDGERRVIARLLGGPPTVIATGGGAYMDPRTRALIRARATSVWIKADVETLWQRVQLKPGRPLLETANARETLEALAETRYPVYAEADVTVTSERDGCHEDVVSAITDALRRVET